MGTIATTESPTTYVFTWLLIVGAPYVAGSFDLDREKLSYSGSFNERGTHGFLAELS